jgi:hypothetical protein
MELPDDADTQKLDTEYCIWPRGHPEADIAATESAAYGPQFRFIRGKAPVASERGHLTRRHADRSQARGARTDGTRPRQHPNRSRGRGNRSDSRGACSIQARSALPSAGLVVAHVRSCAAKVCFRAAQQWVGSPPNVQWRWHRGLSTSHLSSSSKWRRSSPVVADIGLGSP